MRVSRFLSCYFETKISFFFGFSRNFLSLVLSHSCPIGTLSLTFCSLFCKLQIMCSILLCGYSASRSPLFRSSCEPSAESAFLSFRSHSAERIEACICYGLFCIHYKWKTQRRRFGCYSQVKKAKDTHDFAGLAFGVIKSGTPFTVVALL